MNNALLSIFFLFLSIQAVYGQTNEWAPVGAEWWYGLTNPGVSQDQHGYLHVLCQKDTIFQGRSSRQLSLSSVTYDHHMAQFDTTFHGFMYTYKSKDTIYYFPELSDTTGSWSPLYYAGDTIGSKWAFAGSPLYGDCGAEEFTLDSISYSTQITGLDSLKLYHITNKFSNYIFYKPYSALFGGTNFLLPQQQCIFDYIYYSPLRCYNDPMIGLIQLETDYPCDAILSTNSKNPLRKSDRSWIYPNPASSYIRIYPPTSDRGLGSLTIFDMSGKLVHSRVMDLQETTVDLSHIPKGFYLLKLTDEQGHHWSKTFLIW